MNCSCPDLPQSKLDQDFGGPFTPLPEYRVQLAIGREANVSENPAVGYAPSILAGARLPAKADTRRIIPPPTRAQKNARWDPKSDPTTLPLALMMALLATRPEPEKSPYVAQPSKADIAHHRGSPIQGVRLDGELVRGCFEANSYLGYVRMLVTNEETGKPIFDEKKTRDGKTYFDPRTVTLSGRVTFDAIEQPAIAA